MTLVSTYDVAIIGAGPAGMTAALYAARADLKTVLLERLSAGGQLATTDVIENYPGFPEGIGGLDVSFAMLEQAQRFGAEYRMAEVSGLRLAEDVKRIETAEGTIMAPCVILATGTRPKLLGVPGEKSLRGRGVSYCAVCDGAFYRGKEVAVVGGGDSAVEEAAYLTRFVEKVYLLVRRDQLRATPVVQAKILNHPQVEIRWNTVVEEILGETKVAGLRLLNRATGEKSELAVGGIFIYVGLLPNNESFLGQVELDQYGYVLADGDMRTNVPGVLVAGDLRAKNLRQVATAVGDGAIAGVTAQHYLDRLK
ncbi:MAG TPA: thioredoxin-disulfide reductase [Firmicutes bacterium]|nr:thioredoxin-disulfide reductase [Bacillota bacterium]